MDADVLLPALALDLVAISVLTYGIYFHRHRRRDLTLGFVGVNVGLFAVASFVSTRPVGLAFGIGLFALLSVIRLRSTQVTQEEIGYYFVAIVIGLVTGWSPDEHWGTTVVLTVVLLGVMYVADHPRMLPRHERRIVVLDKVYRDQFALRAALEKRLHGEITKVIVMSVDYPRGQTQVDARFRPHPYPRPPKVRTPPPPEHLAEGGPSGPGGPPGAGWSSGAGEGAAELPEIPPTEPEPRGEPGAGW